jgi:hypothetical protein
MSTEATVGIMRRWIPRGFSVRNSYLQCRAGGETNTGPSGLPGFCMLYEGAARWSIGLGSNLRRLNYVSSLRKADITASDTRNSQISAGGPLNKLPIAQTSCERLDQSPTAAQSRRVIILSSFGFDLL